MDEVTMARPKFRLGRLLISPHAAETLSDDDVQRAISRHVVGDWGDVGAEEWEENEFSLRKGLRLFSVYHTADGTRFCVVTEHDRSATTVDLPGEC